MSGILNVASYLESFLILAALSLDWGQEPKGRCYWEWKAGMTCRGAGASTGEMWRVSGPW